MLLLLTEQTIERLQYKLRRLQDNLDVQRTRKQEAAALGDFSENDDYQDAKKQLVMLDIQIADVTQTLNMARPLDERNLLRTNRVQVGNYVYLNGRVASRI